MTVNSQQPLNISPTEYKAKDEFAVSPSGNAKESLHDIKAIYGNHGSDYYLVDQQDLSES